MSTRIDRIAGAELQRSLRFVILGVCFGIVFITITTGPPLTGFVRKLGTGDLIYGILMGLPVVGGIAQILAAYWIEIARKRKPFFFIFLFIQRFIWILAALVPFLVPASRVWVRIWLVVTLISLSSLGGSIGNVAFLSWMSDLVPDNIRGRFFSQRNTVATIVGCLAGLAVGRYLDLYPGFAGFTIVFIIAALFGVVEIACFFRVSEPPMIVREEKVRFFPLLVESFRNRNFRRYMIFWIAWSFGVNVVAPFFNVYMLEHLRLSYLQISFFVQFLASAGTVIFVRAWGRLADRYGNRPVMAICGGVASFIPLFWLFTSPSNYFVVPIVNFISGAFWSGIELTFLNLLLGLSPDKNRSMYVANFMLVASLFGVAIPFIIGGWFLDDIARPAIAYWHIAPFGVRWTQYHLLFVVSTVLRILALVVFFPGVKEKESKETGYLLQRATSVVGRRFRRG